MRAVRFPDRAARVLALAWVFAAAAHATTFYVTIAGLGGEPDYEQRFKMWADDVDGSLKKAGLLPLRITLHINTRAMKCWQPTMM